MTTAVHALPADGIAIHATSWVVDATHALLAIGLLLVRQQVLLERTASLHVDRLM